MPISVGDDSQMRSFDVCHRMNPFQGNLSCSVDGVSQSASDTTHVRELAIAYKMRREWYGSLRRRRKSTCALQPIG